MRIGILGYGNLGRGVEAAVRQNPVIQRYIIFWHSCPVLARKVKRFFHAMRQLIPRLAAICKNIYVVVIFQGFDKICSCSLDASKSGINIQNKKYSCHIFPDLIILFPPSLPPAEADSCRSGGRPVSAACRMSAGCSGLKGKVFFRPPHTI